MTSQHQGSAWFHLPHAGVINVLHYTWLFSVDSGDYTQFLMLAWQVLDQSSEPFPQPPFRFCLYLTEYRVTVLQDGAAGLGVAIVHCTSVAWWPWWGHIPLSHSMTQGPCLVLIAVSSVLMLNSAVKNRIRG